MIVRLASCAAFRYADVVEFIYIVAKLNPDEDYVLWWAIDEAPSAQTNMPGAVTVSACKWQAAKVVLDPVGKAALLLQLHDVTT